MNKGVLFVLSGPSGVGKGTVKAQLFEEFEKCLVFSVSATTRKPREGEVDGREYFFIDRDSFERKIRENAFLEHAEFAGNLYGTPREAVNAQLLAGRDVLLEIEVQGALQVMQAMPECVSLFILPPSFEVLEQRLRGRGTETDAVILSGVLSRPGVNFPWLTGICISWSMIRSAAHTKSFAKFI